MKSFYLFCFIFVPSLVFSQSFKLKVRIQNDTTQKLSSANKATLILLKNGMQILKEIKNPSSEFSFKDIDVPSNFPVLIQINYKNTNYNKLVPPVPALRSQVQEVLVYDITNSKKNLEIQSLMQITKKEEILEVLKVFLIRNETLPKKTFYNKDKPIEFFIDNKAENINTFIRQPSSNMDIPLPLKNSKNGKSFDRSILPGTTELQVSYQIPFPKNNKNIKIEDKIILGNEMKRVVFFRPEGLNFKVENVDKKNLEKLNNNIPENTSVVQINYPKNETVHFLIENTSLFFEEKITNIRSEVVPREVQNGKFFHNTLNSILGLLAGLALLFSLSFFVNYKKT